MEVSRDSWFWRDKCFESEGGEGCRREEGIVGMV